MAYTKAKGKKVAMAPRPKVKPKPGKTPKKGTKKTAKC